LSSSNWTRYWKIQRFQWAKHIEVRCLNKGNSHLPGMVYLVMFQEDLDRSKPMRIESHRITVWPCCAVSSFNPSDWCSINVRIKSPEDRPGTWFVYAKVWSQKHQSETFGIKPYISLCK
jgi:hypothetical protein